MIDKLALTAEDIDSRALIDAFKGCRSINKYNQHYDKVETAQDEDGRHLYTLSSEPTKPGANPFKLEFNPSKLDFKFPTLLRVLDSAMDISQAKIQRTDLAADYEISITRAFESLRVRHKRSFKAFSDYRSQGLTGFYAGSKDEVFAAYDKAFEQRTKAFKPTSFKSIKGAPPFVLTRFELRLKYKMTPVKSIVELPFLLTFNPFRNIEAMELMYEENDVYGPFKRKTALHGFQNAYRELNRQNNFKRDYAKHFKESDLPSKLTAIYRENLGQFFEGATGEAY
jgi:hypothetical protein